MMVDERDSRTGLLNFRKDTEGSGVKGWTPNCLGGKEGCATNLLMVTAGVGVLERTHS